MKFVTFSLGAPGLEGIAVGVEFDDRSEETDLPEHVADQVNDPDPACGPLVLYVDLSRFPEVRNEIVLEMAAIAARIDFPRSNAALNFAYEALMEAETGEQALATLRSVV